MIKIFFPKKVDPPVHFYFTCFTFFL